MPEISPEAANRVSMSDGAEERSPCFDVSGRESHIQDCAERVKKLHVAVLYCPEAEGHSDSGEDFTC